MLVQARIGTALDIAGQVQQLTDLQRLSAYQRFEHRLDLFEQTFQRARQVLAGRCLEAQVDVLRVVVERSDHADLGGLTPGGEILHVQPIHRGQASDAFLVNQLDVEQRRTAGPARQAQGFHQTLERQVLMVRSLQHRPATGLQQLRRRLLGIDLHLQY
ncbi:hypothetical protein D3C71_1249800 [compost metagenome]